MTLPFNADGLYRGIIEKRVTIFHYVTNNCIEFSNQFNSCSVKTSIDIISFYVSEISDDCLMSIIMEWTYFITERISFSHVAKNNKSYDILMLRRINSDRQPSAKGHHLCTSQLNVHIIITIR